MGPYVSKEEQQTVKEKSWWHGQEVGIKCVRCVTHELIDTCRIYTRLVYLRVDDDDWRVNSTIAHSFWNGNERSGMGGK